MNYNIIILKSELATPIIIHFIKVHNDGNKME